VSSAVTITNHSGHLGDEFGPDPKGDVTFPSSPTIYNESITVKDGGRSWDFNTSGDVSYTKRFTCIKAGNFTVPNTASATLEQGGTISDSATVSLDCYALTVKKDATTKFTRQYEWEITKKANETALMLSTGQTYEVNYQVMLTAGYTDKDFSVYGTITISNPAPMDAALAGVVDSLPGATDLLLECPSSLTVPAKGTLTCTYSASLPDDKPRINTATVSLQNYTYDYNKVATPAAGTTSFSGTAEVEFTSESMHEIDKCVEVTDTLKGGLGTVCVGDAPKIFEYTYTVGPYEACGNYEVKNTAQFKTEDKGLTGSASATVKITVPCAGGCTLTPGYWKTHSKYGPAPYDSTWALLGEDTPFFLSGQTYYQVLWTPSAGGNAYYILARAYIAAKLNILNGASSTPAVDAAITWAESFFNTYTPSASLSKSVRASALSYASLLDQYNNGYIGPGHCSE
jgi:hypothetical protein